MAFSSSLHHNWYSFHLLFHSLSSVSTSPTYVEGGISLKTPNFIFLPRLAATALAAAPAAPAAAAFSAGALLPGWITYRLWGLRGPEWASIDIPKDPYINPASISFFVFCFLMILHFCRFHFASVRYGACFFSLDAVGSGLSNLRTPCGLKSQIRLKCNMEIHYPIHYKSVLLLGP